MRNLQGDVVSNSFKVVELEVGFNGWKKAGKNIEH
jgi:hypothetical protein